MSTTTNRMTIDAFLDYAATHGRCELIRGEVHHMSPAGKRHGKIAGRLHGHIFQFVNEHDLGEVYTAEAGFVVDADAFTVRASDMAFITQQRDAEADTVKFCPIPPDLCAEVLSPDDRAGDVLQKIDDWLRFGVRIVWVVDPKTRTVTVHEPTGHAQTLHESETLTGGDVLPGFEMPLAKLFK